MVIAGMAAVGPLLGGWLATDVSWRWAFWLNIPFGLLALVGIVRILDETRDTTLQRGVAVPLRRGRRHGDRAAHERRPR